MAVALWVTGPGRVELRDVPLPAPGPDEVLVETLYTAISRGTERLVLEGRVPFAQAERMRCPFQEGDFTFPVKYGYMAVGRVTDGRGDLLGRTVFALAPHQSAHVLPAEAVTPVPPGLPPRRAVLAANMETALNVVWDAAVMPGDRVAVIGAGVIGLMVASLAAGIPGTEVTVVDADPTRSIAALALGLDFARPEEARTGADVVVNASGSGDGLGVALSLAGLEATVVEASWHGDSPVTLPLGDRFHDQRLRIVSSQVGRVPPVRAPRWSTKRRLAKALDLLADPKVDVLISGESAIQSAAEDYVSVVTGGGTLAHLIRYDI